MTEMKFAIEAKTTYRLTLDTLECVPAEADLWKGLMLAHQSKLDPELTDETRSEGHDDDLTLDEIAFEETWLGEVTRTAVDMLPMHGPLVGAHFYLGHFNEDNKPMVAVLGKEMDNYGADDITYNGWRVTVHCDEFAWDFEGM